MARRRATGYTFNSAVFGGAKGSANMDATPVDASEAADTQLTQYAQPSNPQVSNLWGSPRPDFELYPGE